MAKLAKLDGTIQAKSERRLSMVTCYDYTLARLPAQTPADGILAGDSAARAMHGHGSAVAASVEPAFGVGE